MMDGHEHPKGALAPPPPGPPPRQRRLGFTMIPNGAGLAGRDGWKKHRNRRTDGASTNHVLWPAPAPTPHMGPWSKGAPSRPGPICPGKGRQGGEVKGPGRQGAGHQGPERTRTRNG